jgi:hypothetical protein
MTLKNESQDFSLEQKNNKNCVIKKGFTDVDRNLIEAQKERICDTAVLIIFVIKNLF